MNSKITVALRIVLGLILVVFGANKFLNFMPAMSPTGDAATYMTGLTASGFMFPLLGILEVLIGVLLVTKKAIPFALILLAPLSVNMVLYHGFLDIANILPAALVFILNAVLMYANWDRFKSLFN